MYYMWKCSSNLTLFFLSARLIKLNPLIQQTVTGTLDVDGCSLKKTFGDRQTNTDGKHQRVKALLAVASFALTNV